jgi:hypothetical protein
MRLTYIFLIPFSLFFNQLLFGQKVKQVFNDEERRFKMEFMSSSILNNFTVYDSLGREMSTIILEADSLKIPYVVVYGFGEISNDYNIPQESDIQIIDVKNDIAIGKSSVKANVYTMYKPNAKTMSIYIEYVKENYYSYFMFCVPILEKEMMSILQKELGYAMKSIEFMSCPFKIECRF